MLRFRAWGWGSEGLELKVERTGGFPKLGTPFRGPDNKGYSILGSILGSPYLGKLPTLFCLCESKQWNPRLFQSCSLLGLRFWCFS